MFDIYTSTKNINYSYLYLLLKTGVFILLNSLNRY